MKVKGLHLKERDQALFRYLFLHKLARITDIQIDVFGGVSRQAVQRRVQKLVIARYLECTYLTGVEKKLIYSLGPKAVKDCIGGKDGLERNQIKSSSPVHDLLLLKLARWLKERNCVKSVFTENGIRAGFYEGEPDVEALKPLNPDLVIRAELHGKSVLLPVEYERMEKFSARYGKIIRRCYQNKAAEAVLYLCENSAIQRKISQQEKQEKPPHKLFYALLSDWKDKIEFQNIDGITLTIE